MMAIASDIQKLNPGDIVEMFVIDATNQGGGIVYFHPGVNELGNNLVWQGQEYQKYPIEASGFEKRANGSTPRPTIRLSNLLNALGALAGAYDDFVGARVTRRRTLVKYLDAVNFAAGNALADSTAAFPDEIFTVDRKANENKLFIEWELTAATDLHGVMLPRRQVIQNVCTVIYRSAECGYAGGPVADINDNATTISANDVCGKRLSSCKLRFGEFSPLPFGGFPGAGLLRG